MIRVTSLQIEGVGWGALLLVTAYAHVLVAPFTKVEESFNLQAVHDLCHLGLNTTSYDHLQFPGVVPRTFIGALAVALAAGPVILVLQLAGFTKLAGLYITRVVLASYTTAGLLRLCAAVSQAFGRCVAACFVLITCVQFHLLFYAGRPLPNTFALALTCWAVAEWLLGRRPARVICILAFTTLVVRCDLLPFAALVGLHLLLTQRISLGQGLLIGAVAAAASLALSVAVDSFFWQRWLWPEGTVLWFNTVMNKSSEWGTQPMHWYFTSALPRSLLAGLPLGLLGCWLDRRLWPYLGTTLAYVALYSALPHKELRFLLPVLPIFNVAAAVGLASLYINRGKSKARLMAFLAAVGLLLASIATTGLFLAVSKANYPGGHALQRLHKLEGKDIQGERRVHIGVLPAMTGVSRFGELGPPWLYSKEEDIPDVLLGGKNFTHLLSAGPSAPGYDMLEAVEGYSGVAVYFRLKTLVGHLHEIMPVRIIKTPQVYIHRRTLV